MEHGENMDQMCRGTKLKDIAQVIAHYHSKGLRLKHGLCYIDTDSVCPFHHIFE